MAGTLIGARKAAAAKHGLPLEEYEARLAAGEKWCWGCQATHPVSAFSQDSSRSDGLAPKCRDFTNRRARGRYIPHPRITTPGQMWRKPPRSGDRRQARGRINYLVNVGSIPDPNDLACADCGHEHARGERRHEYDHYLGYDAEHHETVQAVCTLCHRRRVTERGEIKQQRDDLGRYVRRGGDAEGG